MGSTVPSSSLSDSVDEPVPVVKGSLRYADDGIVSPNRTDAPLPVFWDVSRRRRVGRSEGLMMVGFALSAIVREQFAGSRACNTRQWYGATAISRKTFR